MERVVTEASIGEATKGLSALLVRFVVDIGAAEESVGSLHEVVFLGIRQVREVELGALQRLNQVFANGVKQAEIFVLRDVASQENGLKFVDYFGNVGQKSQFLGVVLANYGRDVRVAFLGIRVGSDAGQLGR